MTDYPIVQVDGLNRRTAYDVAWAAAPFKPYRWNGEDLHVLAAEARARVAAARAEVRASEARARLDEAADVYDPDVPTPEWYREMRDEPHPSVQPPPPPERCEDCGYLLTSPGHRAECGETP